MTIIKNHQIEGSYTLKDLTYYNYWIVNSLMRLHPLEGKIFEFGSGYGGVTLALAKINKISTIYANDISKSSYNFFNNELNKYPKISFISENINHNHNLLKSLDYDIAVTSNTLEHVENDGYILNQITENSKKKISLVLVPAFNFLYGTCDYDGGHLRRYTKKTFRDMCCEYKLIVEKIEYINMIGAFAWWLKYVMLKQTDYTSKTHQNSFNLFDRILPLYSKLEQNLFCPFGLSLIAKVKK